MFSKHYRHGVASNYQFCWLLHDIRCSTAVTLWHSGLALQASWCNPIELCHIEIYLTQVSLSLLERTPHGDQLPLYNCLHYHLTSSKLYLKNEVEAIDKTRCFENTEWWECNRTLQLNLTWLMWFYTSQKTRHSSQKKKPFAGKKLELCSKSGKNRWQKLALENK